VLIELRLLEWTFFCFLSYR